MKHNKIVLFIIFLFIAYIGYVTFVSAKKAWKEDSLKREKVILGFPALCEAGKWVEISEKKGEEQEFEGETILKKTGGNFSDEEGKTVFDSADDHFLDYFENKKVLIGGTWKNDKKVFIEKIKCVGAEADKELQPNRQKTMRYIASDINSLSSIRNESGAWKVTAFHFVNESDFYVEYAGDPQKNKDETMLWLVRASKTERAKPVLEGLAYIKNTGENRELIKGEDIHRDAKNLLIYKYDEILKKWILK